MASMPTGGDWYIELVHPDDRNELLSRFLDAFETRETLLCTSRLLGGDGSYRHIKTYAYAEPDARGEIGALVGLAEDVTQEVLAREALERSEAKYRLMAEQASDIIHHISPDARILYVSPSVEAIIGYPPEMVDDFQKFMSWVHPDDLKRLIAAFGSSCASATCCARTTASCIGTGTISGSKRPCARCAIPTARSRKSSP
jgi:PAS domain-containing protein